MADPQQTLTQRLTDAITAALGGDFAGSDPMLRPSGNPKFGDYQANAAMALAKQAKVKPRDLAQRIIDVLDVDDLCDQVEIAGPGFINLHLRNQVLDEHLASLAADERLGLAPVERPHRVVVDYSGPNVAKEMHVGHLRSTVIGDAIVRVLGRLGHDVIRQNHLGDWGTQFGMLIEHMLDTGWQASGDRRIGDLDELYRAAKRHFDQDPDFADRARKRVVALQSGDEATLRIWRELIEESKRHFNEVYERLDVSLTDRNVRGESAYNPALPKVVEGLDEAGLLEESQGAAIVWPPGFADKEGNPRPMIVRKSDGGYNYETTDLAAIRHRVQDLDANWVIYVTDARQADHFAMVFWTARAAGWADESVRLDHVPFGTVLGPDRRPFKTREGGTVKLMDLLNEAEQRARDLVTQNNPELAPEEAAEIARVVGIGALKYADLSTDRVKDYVFDWDRMLSFDGNTGPYMQYAYTRVRSIFRRGEVAPEALDPRAIRIADPAERQLALKLVQYAGTVQSVADALEPHRLCNYLYDLASAFHKFFEHCRVLQAEDAATRASRLALCHLVSRTLKDGLGLLGIQVLEKM